MCQAEEEPKDLIHCLNVPFISLMLRFPASKQQKNIGKRAKPDERALFLQKKEYNKA